MHEKVHSVLAEDPSQALMIVDACDGTPLKTRVRLRFKCVELEQVRQQQSIGEWLILRKFVVSESGKQAVMFGMPRKMDTEIGWAHFAACQELVATGRQLGHVGVLVEHSVLDRGIQSSVARLLEQNIRMPHDAFTSAMSSGRKWLVDQLTWTTSAGCSLHDFHNGYKKGMEEYVSDKACMVAMFGIFAALRDSYTALVRGIGDWLPRVVIYEDWDMHPQDQYELWTSLGLKPQLIETLLTLQMRFSGGRLRVARAMEHVPQSASLMIACLVSIWEFQEWTDSRWVSMGSSSRRMVASLLCGIDSLVATLRRFNRISEYYIKAYTNITDRHRRAFVVGALSSHLSDAVLCQVLADNRVPLNLPTIDDELLMESEWIMHIKPSVWCVLAETCNSSMDSLRSECIRVC
jgi:hypothetical protein